MTPAALLSALASLHPGRDHSKWSWLTGWTWEPIAATGVALLGLAYARGVVELWRRVGTGHGVRRWQALCFGLSVAVLVVALLSPVDRYSDLLFSVHMVQHELLLLVAAPLWAMSAPLAAFIWALPSEARQRTKLVLHRPAATSSWRLFTHPAAALLLHVAALGAWHVPALYQAALRSEVTHSVQHLSFFSTAVLFWWALVHGRYGRAGYGVGVVFVFVTATLGGVLGALFTLAERVVYPEYAARSASIGADALKDQQLGGLLMWVPAGVVSTCIGLALFAAWLGSAGHYARRWDVRRAEEG